MPDPRQQLRDDMSEVLRAHGIYWAEDTDGPLDALLAGPLADLAGLPVRVHQLADQWARGYPASTEFGAGADCHMRIAAYRLRALTPDPRQEQQP